MPKNHTRRFTPTGSSQSAAPQKLFSAEHSSLPTISVMDGKSWRSQKTFTVYVTAYAVSENRTMISGYRHAHLLWFLSMVGAPGHGTALQAIYSALCTNSYKQVELDGVGEVALGTKSLDMQEQGYSAHWNYEQQPVVLPGGARAIHGLLEPRSLTMADPQKALSMARRRGSKDDGASETTTKRGKRDKALSLSTQNSSTDTWSMLSAQEERPFFLLMLPGGIPLEEQEDYTAQLYRSFLDRRLPYPLKSEWASPLWQEASAHTASTANVQPLQVWSYPQPWGDVKQEEQAQVDPDMLPMFTQAYLCRPNVSRTVSQIKRLVTGATSQREVPPFRVPTEAVGIGSCDDEKERAGVYV